MESHGISTRHSRDLSLVNNLGTLGPLQRWGGQLQGGGYRETDKGAAGSWYRAHSKSADGSGLRGHRTNVLFRSSAETIGGAIHGAGTCQDRHRVIRGCATREK